MANYESTAKLKVKAPSRPLALPAPEQVPLTRGSARRLWRYEKNDFINERLQRPTSTTSSLASRSTCSRRCSWRPTYLTVRVTVGRGLPDGRTTCAHRATVAQFHMSDRVPT